MRLLVGGQVQFRCHLFDSNCGFCKNRERQQILDMQHLVLLHRHWIRAQLEAV